MSEAPFRLCCGQQHYGAVCPDNKVMCDICFDRFEINQLYKDEEATWNICKECATEDANNRP